MNKKKSEITARITCIIIAIFLWSFVMDVENPIIEREYKNVTVSLTNMSALERQNLVVMEPQEVTANIKVTGKKSEMEKSKFSANNIVAQVDLSGYSEGQVKVEVLARLTDQSSGITISNIEPKEILFTFDKLVTKKIPVTIRTTGVLPENYVLGDIVSKSQYVILSGPRTWVNEVSKVVAVVDLSNRTSTKSEKFATSIVDDEDNDVRGVNKEPNIVDISIPVYRTVSLPIELQTINELPENFSITDINITPSTIMVKGNNNVANLLKLDTQTIDINSLMNKSALEVELILPQGVQLLNPDEKVTIIYNIEETITKEFTYPVSDLNILNLDNELEIEEDDLGSLIRVTLKGFKSVLEPLLNEDLDISIDLADLKEGNHKVEIKLVEIQGITVEEIIPQPLDLTLINP